MVLHTFREKFQGSLPLKTIAPIYYDPKSPWRILFQVKGSVWASVLPYCVLNCAILGTLFLVKEFGFKISFSPNGHALMTLLISYLVVSKINLAFDRYMQCRTAIGNALSSLRELNQFAITFTAHDLSHEACIWRAKAKSKIISLLDCTLHVVRDEKHAAHLARATLPDYEEDPMVRVQDLRHHIYNKSKTLEANLELLERSKMIDMITDFVFSYRALLKLASTPLPFPLVQMGRTFLFIWTFSIPFVLLGVVDELFSALGFVFFLTFGFIGLEFVAMKLLDPFGDGINDLHIGSMRQATVRGIEEDSELFGKGSSQQSMRRFEQSNDKNIYDSETPAQKEDRYDAGTTDIDIEASHDGAYHAMK